MAIINSEFLHFQAYALSPAGPAYSGPGASPTQATVEPFTADSPYFPFNARPSSRLSPAKVKIIPAAGLRAAGVITKDDTAAGTTTTALDSQWGVVSVNCLFSVVCAKLLFD